MNKEEIAQWVIDNRYPKNEQSKMSDAEMYHTLIDKLTPPQQSVSAEIASIDKSMSEMFRQHDYRSMFDFYITMIKPKLQPNPFTPERTAKEEAERLHKFYASDKLIAILVQEDIIYALKSANVSTVWHEEVLTILKGM